MGEVPGGEREIVERDLLEGGESAEKSVRDGIEGVAVEEYALERGEFAEARERAGDAVALQLKGRERGEITECGRKPSRDASGGEIDAGDAAAGAGNAVPAAGILLSLPARRNPGEGPRQLGHSRRVGRGGAAALAGQIQRE